MSIKPAPRQNPNKATVTWGEKVNRIRGLAESYEADEIASMMGIPPAEVREALKGLERGKWWGRCNRTGRTVTAYGKRGIYLRAQIAGWTDWTWGKGDPGEGVQA